jgi:hypothetical protein
MCVFCKCVLSPSALVFLQVKAMRLHLLCLRITFVFLYVATCYDLFCLVSLACSNCLSCAILDADQPAF